MQSGIDSALHMVGCTWYFGVPHKCKQIRYAPLNERSHAPEFPVRIPPPFRIMWMPCAGIKKSLPSPSPIPEAVQPFSFLSACPHTRQITHKHEQFLSRLCLRMLCNPRDRLTNDVNEATLNHCPRPMRPNGFKQAFLAIADDKSGRWNTREDCRPRCGGFVWRECPRNLRGVAKSVCDERHTLPRKQRGAVKHHDMRRGCPLRRARLVFPVRDEPPLHSPHSASLVRCNSCKRRSSGYPAHKPIALMTQARINARATVSHCARHALPTLRPRRRSPRLHHQSPTRHAPFFYTY